MERISARRFAAVAISVAIVAAAAGCGSNNVTGPTPGNGPFNQTITGSVSTFGTARHPHSIPRSGQMTLRLTWASGAVDLDLFLAPAACMQLYPTSACGVLAASDSATGMSEEIVRAVTAGDSFSVFVDNLNPTQAQSYTLTVAVP